MSGWTRPRIEQLLARCLEKVDVSDAAAVYLEGSIAEGFGNATSDIDFIVLRDVPGELAAMPTILFADGQRVEIRSRSLTTMRRMLTMVANHRHASRREMLALDETLLDRCQRFLHATALCGEGEIAGLRQMLPEADLRMIVARWFGVRAEEAMQCSAALAALGQGVEAVNWARSALTLGAKSWLAGMGETYLAKKWVSRQIARAAPEDPRSDRFLRLENPARSGLEPGIYVEQVAGFLRDIGIRDALATAERAVLKRRRGVTTWQIGGRVHVILDKSVVFALSAAAARIWRSLAFHRPLPAVLRGMADEPLAGRAIAEFHRLGLIGLAWQGSGEIRVRRPATIATDPQRPILSIDGMCFPDEEALIRRASVPAAQFAASGMNLVYANLVIENAREDVLGALAAGQWRVMERAGRAMVRHACMAVLSAGGVHPLPPIEEIDAAAGLSGTAELDHALCIENEVEARAALEQLDTLVGVARETTWTSRFPHCFSNPRDWQRAIDIGYDWIILGAFLDADFPLDEARDVIATGGQQPMVIEATREAG
jgi:hypothetical protein